MATPLAPVSLPEWAWQTPEMREALRARDMNRAFRQVQRHGISQGRLGAATGMTQSRVNEIINGKREVTRLDVFERIADGLDMPDDARHLLGLAAARDRRGGGAAFDLAAFPEVVRVYNSQAAAAEEIRREVRNATEMDLLAVRGLGLIALNNSLLRPGISEPSDRVRLRVLLLDPNSPAATQRAAEIGESPAALASGIELAEARLKELTELCDVELYRYRLLPTWRIIRLGPTLFVSAFDAGWEGHESATYKVMRTPHGPLYRGFRRMFEAMLADSERTL